MYGFFFDRDGETIRLPVNTGKLTAKTGGRNKVIDLIASGEFNILKNPALTEFNFKILLPGIPYPFVHTLGDFRKPFFYVEKFRAYRDAKKPVRFIVTREIRGEELTATNLLVSFEEVSTEEAAGEEGDLWVELRLKEYRDIVVVKQEIVSVEADGTPVVEETVERPSKDPPSEYNVVSGDCLWAIAKRMLYDGSRYKEIAVLNGITNPNLIYPGTLLKLPA